MAKAEDLRIAIKDILIRVDQDLWGEELNKEIPYKWTVHGDCVLFPSTAFTSSAWKEKPEVFQEVCRVLKVTKIARQTGPIHNDDFRCPSVELLYGRDPIVTKKENGILYQWDITKCMFSSGNISEKQRIASFNCRGQVIVDLYAGIGYFTLTYLIHSNAKFVYACEWNPEAILRLKNNLRLNKVENRCEVLEGDNVNSCPKNVADHVNLGLIPSSESSWGVACAALRRDTGGILHIHGNVDTIEKSNNEQRNNVNGDEDRVIKSVPEGWLKWGSYARNKISACFTSIYPNEEWDVNVINVVRVKSYGPRVNHLVVDVLCKPA